jgi:hypothetical protein
MYCGKSIIELQGNTQAYQEKHCIENKMACKYVIVPISKNINAFFFSNLLEFS